MFCLGNEKSNYYSLKGSLLEKRFALFGYLISELYNRIKKPIVHRYTHYEVVLPVQLLQDVS